MHDDGRAGSLVDIEPPTVELAVELDRPSSNSRSNSIAFAFDRELVVPFPFVGEFVPRPLSCPKRESTPLLTVRGVRQDNRSPLDGTGVMIPLRSAAETIATRRLK